MNSAALDLAPGTGFGIFAKARVETAVVAPATPVELEILTSRRDFDALEGEWTALYERAGRPGNPFQSFAWSWHWANNFLKKPTATGRTSELFIVTGRKAGRLTMIWPLVRQRTAGLKTLTWLGQPVTQYGDVLVEGDDALAQMRQAWAHIRANAKADAITLYKVRDDAAVAPLLSEIGAVLTHKDRAPYVDMSQSGTFEDYAQQRYSKKRRSYLRRYRRRFEDLAEVRTEVLPSGTKARAVTEELLRFKQDWMQSRSVLSRALSDPRTSRFFLDTAADTERQTGCRISATHRGDELIGANLTYVAKGRAIAHVITYNLKYDRWNPGHLTTYEGLEACKAEGIDVFDFMGPCAPFKLEWSDGTVDVNDWAVPLSVKGTLWARIYLGFARDRLKAAHQALPLSLKKLTSPALSTVLTVG
ncbi:MAG: GNAT family N-acetyltransferase [Alphaproteobacteria bacterium]|nr:GNAT family N-acetyltransferase [Alphaproteobacteria bacterium]